MLLHVVHYYSASVIVCSYVTIAHTEGNYSMRCVMLATAAIDK